MVGNMIFQKLNWVKLYSQKILFFDIFSNNVLRFLFARVPEGSADIYSVMQSDMASRDEDNI